MFNRVAKSVPIVLGLLFLYSGTYKLFFPGEATYAVMALDFSVSSARAILVIVTAMELYLGALLITRKDLRYTLSAAAGLITMFTGFLWYLSTLAHAPSCGCLGLTGIFNNGKHDAIFGVFRNCVILWALKLSYDAYAFGRSPSLLTRPHPSNDGQPV